MQRLLPLVVICFIGLSGWQTSTAEACPMCKVANEDAPAFDANGNPIDVNARPRAYMYSILFMLSMPAVLLSSFGVTFYRMTRRGTALAANPLPADPGFTPTVLPAKS